MQDLLVHEILSKEKAEAQLILNLLRSSAAAPAQAKISDLMSEMKGHTPTSPAHKTPPTTPVSVMHYVKDPFFSGYPSTQMIPGAFRE